jgi:rod shape-determining protein MreB and related proteins
MSATAFDRPQYGSPRDSHAVAPRAIAAGGIDQVEPAAVGIDLGSGYLRVWASGRPMIDVPATSMTAGADERLVRRGRIANEAGVAALLRRLLTRYTRPVPAGAVLVVCRPVLVTANQERLARDVLNDVFEPSHLLFIDAVRAAAIGAGTRSGPLLVADIGAELTELALVADGRVVAARRHDRGVMDEAPGKHDGLLQTLLDLRLGLEGDPAVRPYEPEVRRRPLLLTGGGAARPHLAANLAGLLNMAVRPAAAPRLVAARGAGLAALSTLRRIATRH